MPPLMSAELIVSFLPNDSILLCGREKCSRKKNYFKQMQPTVQLIEMERMF